MGRGDLRLRGGHEIGERDFTKRSEQNGLNHLAQERGECLTLEPGGLRDCRSVGLGDEFRDFRVQVHAVGVVLQRAVCRLHREFADALQRIGKLRLDRPLPVEPSPERGYRMVALGGHVRGQNPLPEGDVTCDLVHTDGNVTRTAPVPSTQGSPP